LLKSRESAGRALPASAVHRLLKQRGRMFRPIKIADLDLAQPLPSLDGLQGYGQVRALVRWHGVPLGELTIPVVGACLNAEALAAAITRELGPRVMSTLVSAALARGPLKAPLSLAELLEERPAPPPSQLPSVTVAVCTRDRPDDLHCCLHAIERQVVPPHEVIVVDNASSSEHTRLLIQRDFPSVRYVLESRPGLDWARNRAIAEASGDVVAFADDDVLVDSRWTAAIAAAFAERPEIDALTGLVLPAEIETEAQWLFERYGGFGRGFIRRVFHVAPQSPAAAAERHVGTGKFGTGANMAFRRILFERIGGFDPALDVGTPTNGGGDLELFFRVIAEGATLLYEPHAIVRHRHRRSRRALRRQIAGNGVGFYSHLVRTASAYPEARRPVFRFGLWWLWWWNLRRPLKALLKRNRLPLSLYVTELCGSLIAPLRYRQAVNLSRAVERKHANEPAVPLPRRSFPLLSDPRPERVAVRTVDVAEPIRPLTDISAYQAVRLFVFQRGEPLGFVETPTEGLSMSAADVRDAAARAGWYKLAIPGTAIIAGREVLARALLNVLDKKRPLEPQPLSPLISASVVVATRDRPDDLRRCLASLVQQRTQRRVEIIVVDNNPASGMTPAVTRDFAGVKLIAELRPGLSYARNAGILASSSHIVIATDDDVIADKDWIEKLVAPFGQDDVMAVTGNVFPAELEAVAQRRFEWYGGLSRGFDRFEFSGERMRRCRRAVPTWRIGSTANAAFRASIFSDPRIGLMDEALGAGMPTGCSEDTYLFYKVLRAGYRIAYEPGAYVWHRHRTTNAAFRQQLFNYSKGHVAYHLTTVLRDGDPRGLIRLIVELPLAHAFRIYHRLRGWTDYPVGLVLFEIVGNATGPWALWQARRRVRRLGRSARPSSSEQARDGFPRPMRTSERVSGV
jgi:GT2 family glycosyltransferase